MNMMGEKDRFNRQVSTSSTELDVINPLSWELEKKKKRICLFDEDATDPAMG